MVTFLLFIPSIQYNTIILPHVISTAQYDIMSLTILHNNYKITIYHYEITRKESENMTESMKIRRPGRPFKPVSKTTTPPENVNYYTTEEAVALLGQHRNTLQAKLRAGTIRGKIIAHAWRIYRDEIFDNSGYYYYFDCLDGIFGDKYLTPAEVNELQSGKSEPLPEGELIKIAKELEASLYRFQKEQDQTYSHGVCIYDCEI